jgi:hypothetical protein
MVHNTKLIIFLNPKKERFYSVVGYFETDTLLTTEGFLKSKKDIEF